MHLQMLWFGVLLYLERTKDANDSIKYRNANVGLKYNSSQILAVHFSEYRVGSDISKECASFVFEVIEMAFGKC
jgi:translation elongation factor EF-Ts